MTRHKPHHERRQEILDSAAGLIDELGYSQLTMERIVERTTLSKGGVYRFFANKKAVALALFGDLLSHFAEVDIPSALALGLPIHETLMRTILPTVRADSEEMRRRRIWLHLLPETLGDPDFLALQKRMIHKSRREYRKLVRALFERDAVSALDGDKVVEKAVTVGSIFMEGLMLVSLSGERWQDLEEHARAFLQTLIDDALEQLQRHAH